MIPFPPVYLRKAGYWWYGFWIPELCAWCWGELYLLGETVNLCLRCGKVQARRFGNHWAL
jgi:hypothetical protein